MNKGKLNTTIVKTRRNRKRPDISAAMKLYWKERHARERDSRLASVAAQPEDPSQRKIAKLMGELSAVVSKLHRAIQP